MGTKSFHHLYFNHILDFVVVFYNDRRQRETKQQDNLAPTLRAQLVTRVFDGVPRCHLLFQSNAFYVQKYTVQEHLFVQFVVRNVQVLSALTHIPIGVKAMSLS